MLGHIYWDPDPVCFNLPVLGHPIVWYGVLFALGFFLGYYVTRRMVGVLLRDAGDKSDTAELKKRAGRFTDRLLWMSALGTLVGARLGHILFYGFPAGAPPWEIFAVWHGGLASHGAAVGVLASLVLCRRASRKDYPMITFGRLLDLTVLPGVFAGTFIRIGNFINQELVGSPSSLPWAVLFAHPRDGADPVPRHPAQIYESLCYAAIFIFLYWVWNRPLAKRLSRGSVGLVSGLFFLMVFGCRFVIEFVKEVESDLLSADSLLAMGQILSLPFIALGVVLIWRSVRKRKALA